tara:strand:+ start:1166 stop:1369 length:204 start_codon:yes stop_codon:yes gene_type:complete
MKRDDILDMIDDVIKSCDGAFSYEEVSKKILSALESKGLLKDTCGTCEVSCGNEHCVTKEKSNAVNS